MKKIIATLAITSAIFTGCSESGSTLTSVEPLPKCIVIYNYGSPEWCPMDDYFDQTTNTYKFENCFPAETSVEELYRHCSTLMAVDGDSVVLN